MPVRIGNYIKEFVSAAAVGAIIGLCTLSFRLPTIHLILHIVACAALIGFFSIILLAPSTILIFLCLVALPIAWYNQPQYGYIAYGAFVLSISYLGWCMFELLRMDVRLVFDQEYKQRYEEYRKRR